MTTEFPTLCDPSRSNVPLNRLPCFDADMFIGTCSQRWTESTEIPKGSHGYYVFWVTLCRRCEEHSIDLSDMSCEARSPNTRLHGEEIVGYLGPHLKSDRLVNTDFLAVARQESLDLPTIDWG